MLGVLFCSCGELACREEDSFVRMPACEGSDEVLDLWPADGVLPPLRLHVDAIKSEPVFVDQAVDSSIVYAFTCLSCFLSGASIAHGNQKIQDEPFETKWVHGQNLIQQFNGEVPPHGCR